MECLHCQTVTPKQRPVKMTCFELFGGVHTAQGEREKDANFY